MPHSAVVLVTCSLCESLHQAADPWQSHAVCVGCQASSQEARSEQLARTRKMLR